jgi:hypothetical protein
MGIPTEDRLAPSKPQQVLQSFTSTCAHHASFPLYADVRFLIRFQLDSPPSPGERMPAIFFARRLSSNRSATGSVSLNPTDGDT